MVKISKFVDGLNLWSIFFEIAFFCFVSTAFYILCVVKIRSDKILKKCDFRKSYGFLKTFSNRVSLKILVLEIKYFQKIVDFVGFFIIQLF